MTKTKGFHLNELKNMQYNPLSPCNLATIVFSIPQKLTHHNIHYHHILGNSRCNSRCAGVIDLHKHDQMLMLNAALCISSECGISFGGFEGQHVSVLVSVSLVVCAALLRRLYYQSKSHTEGFSHVKHTMKMLGKFEIWEGMI